jgi:hypothetical protein
MNRFKPELPVPGAPPSSSIAGQLDIDPAALLLATMGVNVAQNIMAFDNFCYRDLGDFAVDGRRNRDNAAGQMLENPKCLPTLVNLAAPPADDPPAALPNSLPAIRGAAPVPLSPAQTLARANSTNGVRNPWCWEPLPGESVNCAVRRVRFQYFAPPAAEPVRANGYPLPANKTGPLIERLALYTLVPVHATARPGGHVDITIDQGAWEIAHKYCPVPGIPWQPCTDVKELRRFTPRPGE